MVGRRNFLLSLALAAALSIAASTFRTSSGTSMSPVPPYAAAVPLNEPQLFAEDIITTAEDEASITFTPDGKTAYFTRTSPGTLSPVVQVICVSRFENASWTTPEIAPFSGQYRDANPFISPDGSKFFFASNRPVDGKPKRDLDIWVMERNVSGWSEPRNLGAPVNSPVHELSPSVTADGTLYFATIRPGGTNTFGIYRSRWVEGKYTEPESLGKAINTTDGEIDPYISPDQSFLVFVSVGRPDELVGVHGAYNRGDLYISYRKDGAWTKARNLGPRVNSGGGESSPRLSPDGKYFFFTSDRGFATYRPKKPLSYAELMSNLSSTLNGRGNIYQIDATALGKR